MIELDLYAELPCPVKPVFKARFNTFNCEYYNKNNSVFTSYIPNALGSNIKHDIFGVCSEKELPNISITYKYGEIMRNNFIEKYINRGVFGSSPFHELAYLSEVIVINKKGNLRYPKSWKELTNKEYEGRICLFGANNMPDYLLPLMIYKEYGIEYVKKLFYNTVCVSSPADATREIGSFKTKADIFILPYVFAKECFGKRNIEIIIPKEGVLVEPIVALVKEVKKKKTKKLFEFITHKDSIREFCRQGFLDKESLNDFHKVWSLGDKFNMDEKVETVKKSIYKIWKDNLMTQR